MLSLLKTRQTKMDLKTQEINCKSRQRMRGDSPVAGAGAPCSGAPRLPFLTAFTIKILRFEIYLG